MTTADYLESLQNDLETINTSLGLQSGTKFTDIATMAENGDITVGGGSSISDYFYNENSVNGSTSSYDIPLWTTYVKKLSSDIKLSSTTTSLARAFWGYNGETLDLSNFDTRNISDFNMMFNKSNFTSLTLGTNFSVQSATDLSSMFESNRSVTSLDLSQFGQCSCGSLNNMFNNCTSLTSVDLRNFNSTASFLNTNYMFRGDSGLSALQHIDMRSFDFSAKSVNLSMMFGSNSGYGIPNNCEIIVKDTTEKSYFNTNLSRLTNVKTAAEYEAN